MHYDHLPAIIPVTLLALGLNCELPSQAQSPARRSGGAMNLSAKTDKANYRRGDSIFMEIKIENLTKEKIQLASPDSIFFYVVWEGDPNGWAVCTPLDEYQFVPSPLESIWGISHVWLESGTITKQQVIYGGKLGEMPPRAYRFRIAYAAHRDALVDLLEKTYGCPVGVDAQGPGPLPGAYKGALLSEPITITIVGQD